MIHLMARSRPDSSSFHMIDTRAEFSRYLAKRCVIDIQVTFSDTLTTYLRAVNTMIFMFKYELKSIP